MGPSETILEILGGSSICLDSKFLKQALVLTQSNRTFQWVLELLEVL